MEDIPLEEPKPPSLNLEPQRAPYSMESRLAVAANQDTSVWDEHYRKLMSESIDQVHGLLQDNLHWSIIPAPTWVRGKVQLFEHVKSPSHGFYTFRAHAVINGRADRLIWVIRDHEEDTRLPWDHEYVEHCYERERFESDAGESIHVVESEVRMGVPLMWNRHALGIYWCAYDEKTRTYKYVFRTTQHRLFRCPPELVPVIALVGIIVRPLDEPAEGAMHSCEVAMVVDVKIGENVPALIADTFKEQVRERLHLYERVVQQWDTFYKGKDPKKNRN